MELKQFIPQEYCLRCEVCCRFPEQHTVWAPKFTPLEKAAALNLVRKEFSKETKERSSRTGFTHDEVIKAVEINNIPPLLFSQPTNTQTEHRHAHRINLLPCEHGFRCPCFAVGENQCLIYAHRPFECQLYPFLLLEKDGQFFLAQDMKCPYLKSGDANALDAYKHYLQAVFKKQECMSFLSKHRDLFSKYDPHDLEIVCSIRLD